MQHSFKKSAHRLKRSFLCKVARFGSYCESNPSLKARKTTVETRKGGRKGDRHRFSNRKKPSEVGASASTARAGLGNLSLAAPEIPSSARKVRDITRWWVLPDSSAALAKALMDFSSEERNFKFQRTVKVVSNRTLYARRKTVAMSFFIFARLIALKNMSASLLH